LWTLREAICDDENNITSEISSEDEGLGEDEWLNAVMNMDGRLVFLVLYYGLMMIFQQSGMAG
jgi:hypothetical protein